MADQETGQKSKKEQKTTMGVSLPEFVIRATETTCKIWKTSKEDFPEFTQVYSIEEKRKNESCISEQLDWFTAKLDTTLLKPEGQDSFREEASLRVRKLGKVLLGFSDEQMRLAENEGLTNLAKDFFHQARKFDPEILPEDIFQAGRNIWTAGYLQVLLKLEVKLTPAIFAYSLLYPVTDNYLDDRKRTLAEKIDFDRRFNSWLNGNFDKPLNHGEEKVQRLIRMIESQYSRVEYPQVYDGLLAIHVAQDASLRLPRLSLIRNKTDALEISFAKGGTSVLADGILDAGELTQPQMEIIFKYGAFAQLMDDQEDIESDLHDRNLTLFTQAVITGKVEKMMNRLFAFKREILKSLDYFSSGTADHLIRISTKGIDLLLIDAVLRTDKFYSRKYLRRLEPYFPVRFAFMRELRKSIKKKNLTFEKIVLPFINEGQAVG